MGLRRWLWSACCCCPCGCLEEPLVSDNNPYSSFGATLERDDEKNLWSMPHDVSHTEADDDRILYNLIVIHNQQTKDAEEWQRFNYDIYTLWQIRREVRNRWRRILEDLGFQREADSLLSGIKLSTMSDSKNTRKAREMLLRLAEETSSSQPAGSSLRGISWSWTVSLLLMLPRSSLKLLAELTPRSLGSHTWQTA
ncbi:Mreg [Lemmus lemmus]